MATFKLILLKFCPQLTQASQTAEGQPSLPASILERAVKFQ